MHRVPAGKLENVFAVLLNLTEEQGAIRRHTVAMGMQLEIDSGGSDLSNFTGRHEVEQPATGELAVIGTHGGAEVHKQAGPGIAVKSVAFDKLA